MSERQNLSRNYGSLIPPSLPAAIVALDKLRTDVDSASTYEELHKAERTAEAIKAYWREINAVRERAETVIILARHRIGQEEAKIANPPHRPTESERAELTYSTEAERHGSHGPGVRLKKLAAIKKDELLGLVKTLHEKGKEATQTAVLKLANAGMTQQRRAESRAAVPLIDGMDLRIGDCHTALADVADNSVPLILTDPPYGDEAEPLYEWLAQWASQKLIPGGSLICYTGQSRLDRDMRIFSEQLRYWWLLIMKHDQSQRLPGKFVIANFKPVLWYVKHHRRGRTLVPDILLSIKREKEMHDWGQGEGGITSLIEHLTEPGELVVDPFAGTAQWGKITAQMGRLWIGSDIALGGSEQVQTAVGQ